jgi:hypothetical protein
MILDQTLRDDLERLFRTGARFQEYVAGVRCHESRWARRYDALALAEEWTVPSSAPGRAGSIKALALSEPWCIDAVMNVPLLQRLAEKDARVHARIASLSLNPDLGRRFPGRGGRPRVPTLVFFRNDFVEHWSERSRDTEEWFQGFCRRDPIPPLTIVDDRPATSVLEAWMARRYEAETVAQGGALWKSTVREWQGLLARLESEARG